MHIAAKGALQHFVFPRIFSHKAGAHFSRTRSECSVRLRLPGLMGERPFGQESLPPRISATGSLATDTLAQRGFEPEFTSR